jgi:hypothetical protein
METRQQCFDLGQRLSPKEDLSSAIFGKLYARMAAIQKIWLIGNFLIFQRDRLKLGEEFHD